MSKPTPGTPYTVLSGDTLAGIASQAYGDSSLSSRIQGANPAITDPDVITAGQILNIPPIAEREKLKTEQTAGALTGKGPDDLTLIIEDRELPVQAANVIRTMDTVADGWTANIAWVPGKDPQLDKYLTPFVYPKAAVYIGNELIINGVLYLTSPSLDGSGQKMSIGGFSFTADVIDSMVLPPYEINKTTLEDRAKDLIKPIGINVEFETDSGGAFDRITAGQTDTIFSHLAGLAVQRGFLLSSTPAGDLLFLKANTGGQSVGTLTEDDIGVSKWSASYDGRKLYNTYKAVGQSPKSNKNNAIAIDKRVPRSRFMTIISNDSTAGNIGNAAEWRRSKQLAEALTFTVPVSGWYAPNGVLWTPNTLVTIKSETLFLANGFTFLIRQVDYTYGQDHGAVLSVLPPQVYSGEEIVWPWSV